MGKRIKSFVYPKHALLKLHVSKNYSSSARNYPVKADVGMVMHDFYCVKTMTFNHIVYF